MLAFKPPPAAPPIDSLTQPYSPTDPAAALHCVLLPCVAQRGRPSKKQKDEEKQQEAKEKDTDEQQPTDAANNGDHKAAQPTDESKADNAEKTEAADAEEKATGQGEGVEYRAEPLEKGRLYFFYRPKVDAKEVRGTGDVQKFYILMSPEGTSGKPAKEEEVEGKRGEEREALKEGSEGGKKHRLLVVSSKMLPSHGRVRNPWYVSHSSRC